MNGEVKNAAAASSVSNTDMKVILVAEDVDSNYLLLKAFIGKVYKLIHAKNGIEAVEMFEAHNPDLILMDIKMPDMDGLEATRIIRGISTEVPIIALTAFAFDSDRQKAVEAGCNDFLTKPVAKASLVGMIQRFIG